MSKPDDLRSQAHETGYIRRPDWCAGCGLYEAIHGAHRGDCTSVDPDDWPNGYLARAAAETSQRRRRQEALDGSPIWEEEHPLTCCGARGPCTHSRLEADE